jgi:hypothetical protein
LKERHSRYIGKRRKHKLGKKGGRATSKPCHGLWGATKLSHCLILAGCPCAVNTLTCCLWQLSSGPRGGQEEAGTPLDCQCSAWISCPLENSRTPGWAAVAAEVAPPSPLPRDRHFAKSLLKLLAAQTCSWGGARSLEGPEGEVGGVTLFPARHGGGKGLAGTPERESESLEAIQSLEVNQPEGPGKFERCSSRTGRRWERGTQDTKATPELELDLVFRQSFIQRTCKTAPLCLVPSWVTLGLHG